MKLSVLPTIDTCQVLELPKIVDARGNLTFVEKQRHVPFDIKRIFYLYDVPTAADRGAHAHKRQHQFLICLSGSFDVEVNDGTDTRMIHLNRPWKGLHVPPMIWAAEKNFDPGSLCLVLASDLFSEDDYIRDYDAYVLTRKMSGGPRRKPREPRERRQRQERREQAWTGLPAPVSAQEKAAAGTTPGTAG